MESRYELLYIIPTTLTDEEVGAAESKVHALLTKLGATNLVTKRLGKLHLAYPIKRQRHGHFVLVFFTADPALVAKIQENLRITIEVLRYLVTAVEGTEEGQKYDLVQFAEVTVEREDRPRRRVESKEPTAKEELKSGVAAIEGAKTAAPAAAKEGMSTEELDKTIDKALNDDVKGV